jgi:hypothetical protein
MEEARKFIKDDHDPKLLKPRKRKEKDDPKQSQPPKRRRNKKKSDDGLRTVEELTLAHGRWRDRKQTNGR